jgi:hypothetical protein
LAFVIVHLIRDGNAGLSACTVVAG